MDKPQHENLRDEIEVPWDDLRAERTLRSILAQTEAQTEAQTHARTDARTETEPGPLMEASRPAARPGPWLAAAAVVLIGAGVAATWVLGTNSGAHDGGASQPASAALAASPAPQAAPLPPAPNTVADTAPSALPAAQASAPAPNEALLEQGSSLLAFADNAQARLTEHASVRLIEDPRSKVDLAQDEGLVSYRVQPSDARDEALVVEVAHLFIIVQASEFSAQISDDRVELHVESGVLTIDDGERKLELVQGDSLEVERRDARTWPTDAAGSAKRTAKASPKSPKRSHEDLMADADAARSRGDLAASAKTLSSLLAEPGAPPVAWINLGRVEARRGRHVQAARAFENYWQRHASRPLAEDALYQASRAWRAAGRSDDAARTAREYLRAFPAGLHAEQVAAYVP